MCPYMWQDQFNLHEKSGTPVDMHSLLVSLKAIERICSQERSEKSNPSCNKKALHSKKKGTQQPGTEATARVPKNLVLIIVPESQRKLVPRNIATFARSLGVPTLMQNTCDCCRFEKDGTETSDFRVA
jgi:hypothetical protein